MTRTVLVCGGRDYADVGRVARYRDSEDGPERIHAAAIRMDTGWVFYLPQPLRHHDVLRRVWRMGVRGQTAGKRQGFVTDRWRYVDRTEGLAIAMAAGQVRHKHGCPGELFSEDMW